MKEAKAHIIEIGSRLIAQKGYSNVGLNEILKTANVPKGSFYYYFKSKEDFGLQVIDAYSKKFIGILFEVVINDNGSAKERLINFYEERITYFKEIGFNEGCLLGNCSLELSDNFPAFAQQIAMLLNKNQDLLEQLVVQGVLDGSITYSLSPAKIAAFILNYWEGALLRMKTNKDISPLKLFIENIEGIL